MLCDEAHVGEHEEACMAHPNGLELPPQAGSRIKLVHSVVDPLSLAPEAQYTMLPHRCQGVRCKSWRCCAAILAPLPDH